MDEWSEFGLDLDLNPDSDLDDLDFDLDLNDKPDVVEPKENAANPADSRGGVKVSHRMGHRNLSRKAASEHALEEAMDWHFQEGDCYHCFSFGDVDFMSYIKHINRQQKIKYLAISTWCMAGEDVTDLQNWHRRGLIERVDFFVGEIFQGSYPEPYAAAKALCEECGGRIVIFRNHAKIAIIVGERFNCLIESSANVNTNPRSENTVVTVDRQLVNDYLELLAGIKSFSRDFDHVKPWKNSLNPAGQDTGKKK